MPMCWYSTVGLHFHCHMGVSWLLSTNPAIKCTYNQTNPANCPLPGRSQGNMEKPRKDMAFLLIAPSLATGCKRIFGLVAMWAYPCHVCQASLVEVAWCLVLLTDEDPDWPYTFIWMNDTILHVLLSSEGTSASWQKVNPKGTLMASSTSYKHGGNYNVGSG